MYCTDCGEKVKLERVLRKYVPELLWKIFCLKPFGFRGLGVVQPFKWFLTKKVDQFTERRINGK